MNLITRQQDGTNYLMRCSDWEALWDNAWSAYLRICPLWEAAYLIAEEYTTP